MPKRKQHQDPKPQRKPRPAPEVYDWASLLPEDTTLVNAFVSGGRVWRIDVCKFANVRPDKHITTWPSEVLSLPSLRRRGMPRKEFYHEMRRLAQSRGHHMGFLQYATDMWCPDEEWYLDPDCLIQGYVFGEEPWVKEQVRRAYQEQSSTIHEMVARDDTEVLAKSDARKKSQKREKTELVTYHAYDEIVHMEKELKSLIVELFSGAKKLISH